MPVQRRRAVAERRRPANFAVAEAGTRHKFSEQVAGKKKKTERARRNPAAAPEPGGRVTHRRARRAGAAQKAPSPPIVAERRPSSPAIPSRRCPPRAVTALPFAFPFGSLFRSAFAAQLVLVVPGAGAPQTPLKYRWTGPLEPQVTEGQTRTPGQQKRAVPWRAAASRPPAANQVSDFDRSTPLWPRKYGLIG